MGSLNILSHPLFRFARARIPREFFDTWSLRAFTSIYIPMIARCKPTVLPPATKAEDGCREHSIIYYFVGLGAQSDEIAIFFFFF
jgi:hypothetical protein